MRCWRAGRERWVDGRVRLEANEKATSSLAEVGSPGSQLELYWALKEPGPQRRRPVRQSRPRLPFLRPTDRGQARPRL